MIAEILVREGTFIGEAAVGETVKGKRGLRAVFLIG